MRKIFGKRKHNECENEMLNHKIYYNIEVNINKNNDEY